MAYKIETEDGKYTFINDNGIVTVLRHGDLWENGDEGLLSLLQKVERYEEALEFYAFETVSLNEDGAVAKKALGYIY